jgi:hypothetical protein
VKENNLFTKEKDKLNESNQSSDKEELNEQNSV